MRLFARIIHSGQVGKLILALLALAVAVAIGVSWLPKAVNAEAEEPQPFDREVCYSALSTAFAYAGWGKADLHTVHRTTRSEFAHPVNERTLTQTVDHYEYVITRILLDRRVVIETRWERVKWRVEADAEGGFTRVGYSPDDDLTSTNTIIYAKRMIDGSEEWHAQIGKGSRAYGPVFNMAEEAGAMALFERAPHWPCQRLGYFNLRFIQSAR